MLALALALGGCSRRIDRPDVILVVIDTLRWDRLALSGYGRAVSPQIDRFASGSVVFENARAVASWTKPTVGSILTGYPPRQHGARHYDEGLRAVPTLATRLDVAGYTSRAVVANPFLANAGFERGFQQFRNLSKGQAWYVPGSRVTRAAVAALPEPSAGLHLFLYVHYLDPHDPYQPDPAAAAGLVRPYSGPARGSLEFVRGPLLQHRYEPSDADVRYISDLYDAEIRTVDGAVGDLFDALRAAGRYDDAWIVLTADHGEELHDRGGWLHSYTLYEEQIHVPLIVKAPRRLGIEPGRRRALVSQMDIVPTLLEALGLPAKDGDGGLTLGGRSLLASLRDPEATLPERTLFAEQGFGRQDGRHGLGYTGRRGSLKWIEVDGEYSHHPTPPNGECYDLAQDPGERHNLVGTEVDPDCGELAEVVKAWRREDRAEGTILDLPPETVERLRALGYTP